MSRAKDTCVQMADSDAALSGRQTVASSASSVALGRAAAFAGKGGAVALASAEVQTTASATAPATSRAPTAAAAEKAPAATTARKRIAERVQKSPAGQRVLQMLHARRRNHAPEGPHFSTRADDLDEAIMQFERFESHAANCFLPEDRQHLLAVIETGFGSLERFDDAVRSAFVRTLERVREDGDGDWLTHSRHVTARHKSVTEAV